MSIPAKIVVGFKTFKPNTKVVPKENRSFFERILGINKMVEQKLSTTITFTGFSADMTFDKPPSPLEKIMLPLKLEGAEFQTELIVMEIKRPKFGEDAHTVRCVFSLEDDDFKRAKERIETAQRGYHCNLDGFLGMPFTKEDHEKTPDIWQGKHLRRFIEMADLSGEGKLVGLTFFRHTEERRPLEGC